VSVHLHSFPLAQSSAQHQQDVGFVVDGTDPDAGLVDGADTGIRNDVSQGMSPPPTALI